jgi:geranylgeranyl diphosphate synthase, type I
VAAASLLSTTTRELIRGQFEDVAFERRRDVTLAECLAMAAGKTGALLEASASIGAVLAGAGQPAVGALSQYGRHLGLAFQLVDDLLGIWGDPRTTGKPVLADLRCRKMSLPVTRALHAPGPAAAELAAWYATPGAADDEAALQRAADLVEATGARAWAAAEVQRQVRCAHQALASQPFAERPRAELADLADHLARRDA